MARLYPFVLIACLALSCGGPPPPTPDAIGTQVAQVQAVAATLTAAAPTHTATPEPTLTPTATATATYTPTPTPTWTPTATNTPTSTPTPTETSTLTPTPKPTKAPKPTATKTAVPELEVTYRDLHYECQGNAPWTQGGPPYQTVQGYRSFQTLMVMTNHTKVKTLDPPWWPNRWIVTDGNSEWDETYAWQWTPYGGSRYPLPPVSPGATQSWTWLCYPVPRGAWVKAAEFIAWGHTYRFDFPKPNIGDYNYYNCP